MSSWHGTVFASSLVSIWHVFKHSRAQGLRRTTGSRYARVISKQNEMCGLKFMFFRKSNNMLSAKKNCCNFVSVKVVLELLGGSQFNSIFFPSLFLTAVSKVWWINVWDRKKVNYFSCYITGDVALVTKHQLKHARSKLL